MPNENRVPTLLTAVGVLFAGVGVFYNGCNARTAKQQLEVQRNTTNRTWSAALLTTIYSKAKIPVREEAIRAYLAHQYELGEIIRLREVDLSDMNLTGYDFTGADLREAKVLRTTLDGTNFTKADLRSAKLQPESSVGAKFHGTKLQDAICFDANLNAAEFFDAELQGTKFSLFDQGNGHSYTPARLRGAKFRGATFDELTWICGVDASGADLEEAVGLKQRHFSCATAVTTDPGTKVPRGVTIP